MLNDIINALADKNQVKVAKKLVTTQSRLAHLILDRAHIGAKFVKEVSKGDRQNTINTLISMALPGAKEMVQQMNVDISKIHQEAELKAAQETELETAKKMGVNEAAIEYARQNMLLLKNKELFKEVPTINLAGADEVVDYFYFTASCHDGKTYITAMNYPNKSYLFVG